MAPPDGLLKNGHSSQVPILASTQSFGQYQYEESSNGYLSKKCKQKDKLTAVIGVGGRWQILTFVYLSGMVAWDATNMFNMKFSAYPVDYWCQRPVQYGHLSAAHWLNLSAPLSAVSVGQPFDRCHVFDLDWDGNITARPAESTPSRPCLSWEYDDSHFGQTVTQRWNLVCGPSAYLPRFAQSAFFLGNFLGVLSSGWMADRLGRRPVILAATLLSSIGCIVGSLAPNITVWIVSRFCVGATILPVNTIVRVFMAESTSAAVRPFLAAFNNLFCQMGTIGIALIVYLIPRTDHMELCTGLIGMAFLPLFYFLPESPRWLMATGKVDQANKVIRHICKVNNRPYRYVAQEEKILDRDESATQGCNCKKTVSLCDLFRLKGLRRNLVSMWLAWFGFSFGFYGMMYNTPATQSNVYLVFMMPAFGGIVNVLTYPFLQRKLGRKAMLTGPLVVSGILIITSATVVPREYTVTMVALSIVGTTICNGAFDTGYIYAKELFPTVLRSSALSAASGAARIGSLLTPLIGTLDTYSPTLPVAVFGVVVLAAGLQSVVLWPETAHTELADTLEEGEAMANTPNKWLHCCQQHQKTNRIPEVPTEQSFIEMSRI